VHALEVGVGDRRHQCQRPITRLGQRRDRLLRRQQCPRRGQHLGDSFIPRIPAYETSLEHYDWCIATDQRHHAAAGRDALTGLLDRDSLLERLADDVARAFRHDRPLCVAVLELDRGADDDATLTEAAGRLRALVRAGEHMAHADRGRFVWILPDAAGDGGTAASERARSAIFAASFPGTAPVTLSAGVCEFASAGFAPDRMLAAAEEALLAAHREGGNCVRLAQLRAL
jgi:diguanylate cyclase (GGDEF)-like protein